MEGERRSRNNLEIQRLGERKWFQTMAPSDAPTHLKN